MSKMLHSETTKAAFDKINDSRTYNDPSFYGGDFLVPTDHGTSHTCVLAPNGDAVSVTSTVNLHFGAGVLSPSTGIIYNDEMDDFSSPNITNNFGLPPSPTNFIKPGKRPLSSMSPAVVVDRAHGDVQLITGAAGGTKITTATALTTLRALSLQQRIDTAITTGRIHHQLMPMKVTVESTVPDDVIQGLHDRGHVVEGFIDGSSIVTGIQRGQDGKIYASSDPQKDGGVDGF